MEMGFKRSEVGSPKTEGKADMRFGHIKWKFLKKGTVNKFLLSRINEVLRESSDFRLLTSDKINIPTKLTAKLNFFI
jgi:hypothetical protein